MTDETLGQPLAFAMRRWPVLPCQPGRKIPATPHGYQDAIINGKQVIGWFGRHPDWNLAIGAPGPNVPDVDEYDAAAPSSGPTPRLTAWGPRSA